MHYLAPAPSDRVLPAPTNFTAPAITAPAVRAYPSIDALRVFAALAVICLHSEPLAPGHLEDDTSLTETVYWIIQALCLFAVPYFFIVSGYFFGKDAEKHSPFLAFKRLSRRLMPMFLFWNLFYALLPTPYAIHRYGFLGGIRNCAALFVDYLLTNPLHFLLNGSSMQLWFLPASVIAAALAAVLLKLKRPWLMFFLALGLFTFGLMGQAYREVLDLAMSSSFGINTRIGPFYGTPIFFLGIWCSRRGVPTKHTALLCALGGMLLLLVEANVLDRLGALLCHYYIGSVPLALGLLWLCLGSPGIFGKELLPRLGRLTPGVYLMHTYLLTMFEQLSLVFFESILLQLLLPFILFAISAALTLLLRQVPPFRQVL